MLIVYFTVILFTLLCGLSAVWALAWAVQRGEFRDFRAGAASIFDHDEPLGRVTDRFPDKGAAQ